MINHIKKCTIDIAFNKKAHLIPIVFLLCSLRVFGQPFNVMTYNIRLDVEVDGENKWDNRKEIFSGQIKFYEPDVLGLQESLPDQVNYLDNNLSDYDHIGVGREGVNKGESSPIFYNIHRLELLKDSTFWLSQTPDIISKGWDASYLRVCTFALFSDKKSKRQFWVFNTHLDNNGVESRVKSIELVLAKINSVNTENLPVIFMGDFNETPDNTAITNLKKAMNDSKEISVAKPFGPSGSFNNFEFNKPVTRLIDYVFVSKNPDLIVNKYAILSDSYNLKYPSDHLPVFVQINLMDK
jgi:endonuclease/exonuclease/phosphatase family metal-dependent hydrolase